MVRTRKMQLLFGQIDQFQHLVVSTIMKSKLSVKGEMGKERSHPQTTPIFIYCLRYIGIGMSAAGVNLNKLPGLF